MPPFQARLLPKSSGYKYQSSATFRDYPAKKHVPAHAAFHPLFHVHKVFAHRPHFATIPRLPPTHLRPPGASNPNPTRTRHSSLCSPTASGPLASLYRTFRFILPSRPTSPPCFQSHLSSIIDSSSHPESAIIPIFCVRQALPCLRATSTWEPDHSADVASTYAGHRSNQRLQWALQTFGAWPSFIDTAWPAVPVHSIHLLQISSVAILSPETFLRAHQLPIAWAVCNSAVHQRFPLHVLFSPPESYTAASTPWSPFTRSWPISCIVEAQYLQRATGQYIRKVSRLPTPHVPQSASGTPALLLCIVLSGGYQAAASRICPGHSSFHTTAQKERLDF